MNPCVIIPSYNEARTIGDIVRDIKSKNLDTIVIDDGSFDDTAKIAAREGAIVISHVRNLGKGASIKEGFGFILKSTIYDTVIVMDGDGQHHPEDIDRFIEHAKTYDNDIILGNRMGYTKNMPRSRLITNIITSFFISLLCKQHIPDSQCGFRLLKRRVIDALRLTSSKYDTESEMLIDASRKGFKIASVPIRTIYSGEKSQIHPVRDTLRLIGLLVKSYFRKDKGL